MTQPLVAIIILNHNNREDTLACLRSLEHLTYSRAFPIVLDNGSSDGSAEAIRAQYPNVKLIETGDNLGFTGGNNIGIHYALNHRADYVMLLNNDTIVAPDMLGLLVEVMHQDPQVGIAGPTIYYHDQPDLIWSAGGSIDWKRGITSMTAIGTEDKGQLGTSVREVEFVTGCALLARRDVWEKVGDLDERFFMYYEETEWCVRAARAGFKIVHVPAAMLWNKISNEGRAASPHAFYYMTRNRLLFLRHTGASLRTWLYTFGDYARTLISWSFPPRWQDRGHLRKIMLLAISDAGRGRWGKQMARRA
jgi:GT2 family glycosyltransferase